MSRPQQNSTAHAIVIWFLLIAAVSGGLQCIRIPEPYAVIPPGIWRGTLTLASHPEEAADERTRGFLPFNFEVVYVSNDSFNIIFINGEERIYCENITYGSDTRRGRDTLRFYFPVYRSYVSAEFEEGAIEGYWCDPTRGAYCIPFRAYHSRDHRFQVMTDVPPADFGGRWQVLFNIDRPEPTPALGIFRQDGHRMTGTFIRATGDDRFLEGNADKERLYLSVFDGSHAYLFEAKLQEDGTLAGVYHSGNHYKTYWTAVRDDTFDLADPSGHTQVLDVRALLDARFPNPESLMISPSDPEYAGRPRILQIFGTWCPNCRDESEFLSQYLRAHPELDISVLSWAFERYRDTTRAMEAISYYKQHFDIPWEILYAGPSNKQEASARLPMLSEVFAFPTMIFIDRNDEVVKVHTGFFGPATDRFEAYREAFEQTIRLITEQATQQ